MATVGVVHLGLGGHVGPATRLGGVLVQQGHRVLAWAGDEHRDAIEATRAEFRAFDPAPVKLIHGGLAGFAATLLEGTEQHVSELIEELLAVDVQLVVHDYHAVWARVAAEFLGLPRIVSNPLFPVPRSAPGGPRAGAVKSLDLYDASLFPPGWEKTAERDNAVAEAIGRRWGVELGAWYDAIRSPGPTVTYTTEAITGISESDAGVSYVGPLMAPLPSRPPDRRPLVYVAFGTFSTHRPDTYRVVIDALRNEPVDVLVSTGGGPVTAAALEPLPPNTRVHEYVESRDVLARSTVHVTHAGCSSMHESLLAGVPMVCVPQAVDQFLWAERVEQLGAGSRVELSTDAVRTTVRALLNAPEPRAVARDLGVHLRGYDGEARLAGCVARALGERRARTGSSGTAAAPS